MSSSFSLDDDLNDEQLFAESFKDIDGFGSLDDMMGDDDNGTENTMDAALTAILQKAEDEINAVNDDQGSMSFSDDEDDLLLSGSEKRNKVESGGKDASPGRKTLEEKRAALYTGSQPLEVMASVTAFTSDYAPLRTGAGASGLGKNGKLNFRGAVRKIMLGNRITNMLTEDAISLSQHDASRYVSYLRNHRFEEPKMARLLPPMAIYCQKHPGVLDEVAKVDGITLLIELAFLYLTPICVLSELNRAENITEVSASPGRRKRQHPHVRISNAIGAILIQAAKRNAAVFNAGHIASVVALQCKKHCITMEAASRVAWDAAAANLAPVHESNEQSSPLPLQQTSGERVVTPLDETAPEIVVGSDSLSSCSTNSRVPTPLMDTKGSSAIPELSINMNTLPLPDFSSTSPTTRKKNRRDHDLETVKTRVMQALADTYFTVDWCHAVLCILALFEPTVFVRPEILAMGMQALEYIRGRRGRHIERRGGVTNDTPLLRMYECLMAVDQWSLLMLLNQMGKWLSISTTALMEDEEIAKDAMLSTSTKTTTQMAASAMAIVSGTFESTNSTVTLLMAFVLRSLTAQSLEARHHQNNMEGSYAGDDGERSTGGGSSTRGSKVGFSAIHMALSVMSVRRKSTRSKSPRASAAVPDHLFDALTVLEYLIDLDEDNAFMLLCSEACDFSISDNTTAEDASKVGRGQRQVSPMASVIHVLLTVLADISQRYAVDYPAKNCGRIPNTVTKIVAVLNRLLRTKALLQTGFACALRPGVSVEAISGMVSTSVGSISHDSPLLFVPTRPKRGSMVGNEIAGSDLGFTTFDMEKMQTHILQPFPGESPLEDLVLGSFSVCQYLWSEPQLMYTKLIDELLVHAPPNSLSLSLLNDSNRNMTRNLLGMKLREVKPLFSKFKELLGEGGGGGGGMGGGGNHGKSERLSSEGFARSLAVSMGNAAVSRRVSTLGANIGGGGGAGLDAHSIMNEALFSVLQDRLRELSLLTSTWINLLRDQIRATKKCARGEVRSVVSALIFVSDFASTLYTEGQEDTAASSVTHLGVADTSAVGGVGGGVVGDRTPAALMYTAPANLKQTAFATVGALTSLLRDITKLKGGSWQEVIDGSTLDAPLELTGVIATRVNANALRGRRASFAASPPMAPSKLRNSAAEMASKYPLFTALSQSLTTLLRRTESSVLDALVKDGPINIAVSTVISAHDVASDIYSLFRHIHGTTGAMSPTAEMMADIAPPGAIADYSNILNLVSAASDVVMPLIVTTITTAPSTTPSGGTRSLDASSLGETFTLATTTSSRFRGKCIAAADLPSYYVQLTDMVERLVHAVTLHCQASDNDVDFMGSSAVLGDENTVDQLVSLFRDCTALYTAAAPETMQWAPQTLYHILALLLRCKADYVAQSGLVDVLLGFMHALTSAPNAAPTLSWSSHITMMVTLVNRCAALNRPLLISMRDDTVNVAISTSSTVQIPRHVHNVLALLSSRTQFGVSHPVGRSMLGVSVVTPTSVTLSSGGTRTDYLQLSALIATLMGGDELSASGSFSHDEVNDLLDSTPGYAAITQGLHAHPLLVECLAMFPPEAEGSPLTSEMSITVGANPVTSPNQAHHHAPADAMSSKNQHKRLCALDDDTLSTTTRFFRLVRQVCDVTNQQMSVGDDPTKPPASPLENTAAQKRSHDVDETQGIETDELVSRRVVISDATSAFVELAIRFGTTVPPPPQQQQEPQLQSQPIKATGVDAETNTTPQQPEDDERASSRNEVNAMVEVVEEDSVADRALHTILASSVPPSKDDDDDHVIYEEIKEAHRRQMDVVSSYNDQQRLMLEEQAVRATILQEAISKTFHLSTQITTSVGKCGATESAALHLKIEMLQDDAKAAEANSKKLDTQIQKYRDRAHKLDKQLATANSDREDSNTTISQLREEIEQLHVAVATAKRDGEDALQQSSMRKSKSLPEAPPKPKVVITDQVRDQLQTYIDTRNTVGIAEIMGVIQTAQKEMEVQAARYETELELANEAICEKQDRLEMIGARIDRAVKTEEENKHFKSQILELEEKLKRVSKHLDSSLSITGNHQLEADSSICISPNAASRRPQSAMSRASNTTANADGGDGKDIKRVTGRLVISQQHTASLQKEVGALQARCDQLMIEGVEARRKLAHFETINTTDKGGMKWARARMKRLERRRAEMLEAAAEREEASKISEEKARTELKGIKKSSKGVEEKCERLIAGIETELEIARKQIETQKGDIRRNEMFIQQLQHKSELLIAGGAALPKGSARRASSHTSPPATHYAAAPRTSRPASAAVSRQQQSVERAMRKVVGAGLEGDDNDGGKTFVVPSVTDKMPKYDATSDVHLKSYFAWKNIKKRQPSSSTTTPSSVRAKRDEITEHRQK